MSDGANPASLDEQVVCPAEDLELAIRRLCLPALVERHHDDRRPEPAHLARLGEELLLALLQRDRIDDPLSLDAPKPRLDHRPPGGVDHDRQPRHLRLRRDQVEERRHRLLAVQELGVHVDVEQVRAAAHLFERDVDRLLPVAALDEAPEARGARHIRPLADHHERRVVVDRERLEAAEARAPVGGGNHPRRDALHLLRDLADVLGRRPTTSPDAVDEAVEREAAEQLARLLCRLVVAAEGIRQACVRIAEHRHGRNPRELGEKRPHLGGSEGAVHRDRERVGVLDRDPERLHRLAGQRPSAAIDDGERDHDREVGGGVPGCDDRRLGVERVEHRLDDEQVDAALGQRCDLLGVRVADLVEGARAVGGLVDARRERQRHVQRADRAGDETRPVGRRDAVTRCAGDPRRLEVDLAHERLEAVVGLPDRRRGERVRDRDVGAGREIGVVDLSQHGRAASAPGRRDRPQRRAGGRRSACRGSPPRRASPPGSSFPRRRRARRFARRAAAL